MTLPINLVVATLAVVVSLAWAGRRAQQALHMLQLDSYGNDRFLQWLAAQPGRRLVDPLSGLCQAGFLVAALVQPTRPFNGTMLLAGCLICQASLLVYVWPRAEKPKKPLVYTGRAWRILGTSMAVSLAVMGG